MRDRLRQEVAEIAEVLSRQQGKKPVDAQIRQEASSRSQQSVPAHFELQLSRAPRVLSHVVIQVDRRNPHAALVDVENYAEFTADIEELAAKSLEKVVQLTYPLSSLLLPRPSSRLRSFRCLSLAK
jgi:hypothetical protein